MFTGLGKVPSRQNLAHSAGNTRVLWLLVEGIQVETWVVSETRIQAEIQGNFQTRVEMRGKLSQTTNILIQQRMTSNHHWDIFPQLGPFPCHYIAF